MIVLLQLPRASLTPLTTSRGVLVAIRLAIDPVPESHSEDPLARVTSGTTYLSLCIYQKVKSETKDFCSRIPSRTPHYI